MDDDPYISNPQILTGICIPARVAIFMWDDSDSGGFQYASELITSPPARVDKAWKTPSCVCTPPWFME